MKNVKKLGLGLFIMSLAGVALGCSSDTSTKKAETKKEDKTEEVKKDQATDSGDLGDFHVAIQDFSRGQDFEGSEVGIVQYEFTNNSEDNQMFTVAISPKVFQNGVALDSAVMTEDGFSDGLTEIQPGAKITIKTAYKLADTENPVSVEISPTFSLKDEKLTKEFTLQ